MGLLDLLLNRKNLTFDWVPDPDLRLVVDLDRSSFCGVPVGGPLRDLARLGPADDPRANRGTLRWMRRGFYLIRDPDDAERMQGFVLHTIPPVSFECRFDGRDVEIHAEMSPDDLRRVLGDPFHEFRDDESGEIVWFYEAPAAEWQFAWGSHGWLEAVEISAWRELADEGSRESYGCARVPPYG